jgi:hypothetical protein
MSCKINNQSEKGKKNNRLSFILTFQHLFFPLFGLIGLLILGVVGERYYAGIIIMVIFTLLALVCSIGGSNYLSKENIGNKTKNEKD